VRVGGVEVRRASLHNEDELQRKDIRIGDAVIVQRAGDVIPEVVKSIAEKRTGEERLFEMPTACPACDLPVMKDPDGVYVRCNNSHCPAQVVERIFHFASKSGVDIDGIGAKLIDQMVTLGLIGDAADLYYLTMERLSAMERMGEKLAENILGSIEQSKRPDLPHLINALGIRNVGEHLATVLAGHFATLENLISATAEELSAIDEIGPIVAESIRSYFDSKVTEVFLQKLSDAGMVFPEQKKSTGPKPLDGQSIVITGTLEDYSRSQAKKILENLGARVVSSVSKRTDAVLVGANPGSKHEKAMKLGVKILTESEFVELAGGK
jgi:DNA ligase (NAD+)